MAVSAKAPTSPSWDPPLLTPVSSEICQPHLRIPPWGCSWGGSSLSRLRFVATMDYTAVCPPGFFDKSLFFMGEFGLNDYNSALLGKTMSQVRLIVPDVVRAIAEATEVTNHACMPNLVGCLKLSTVMSRPQLNSKTNHDHKYK